MMSRRMELRRLAKTGIACALRWTGADEILDVRGASRGLPLVLGYHSVVEDIREHADDVLPGMMTSQRMLAQHLDWIGRSFRFVSLDELGERLARGDASGEPLAAVTFDDGYQDVYLHAFPLLKEMGIPAAVFVVTDIIEAATIPLHDRLYLLLARAASTACPVTQDLGHFLRRLGIAPPTREALTNGAGSPVAATRLLLRALPQGQLRRVIDALEDHVEIEERVLRPHRPLTWEMVAELSRAGITIGSHTRSHPVLSLESPRTVLEEVRGSRRTLEDALGITVRHFAYPGGHFNRAVVRTVADSGYGFGYTTCGHRDPEHPLLTIPRTALWETSSIDARGRFSEAILSCQIHGVFTARCHDPHGAESGAETGGHVGR